MVSGRVNDRNHMASASELTSFEYTQHKQRTRASLAISVNESRLSNCPVS